jgi:hypothetical protein
MRGWVASVLVVAGCGRLGFGDASDGGALGDGVGDGGDDGGADAEVATGYCARIPPLGAVPTLDGTLEAGLTLETLVPVGWQSGEVPLPPVPNVPVQFAIAYRADALYFFLDVADPDRFPARSQDASYCGDGVELYVDHDGMLAEAPLYDTIGALQFIARAPVDAMTPRTSGEVYFRQGLVGAWQAGFVATPRSGGYTFEAVVDAATMGLGSWSLASSGRVGIDLSLNLSTSDGATVQSSDCPQNVRLGQFFLRIDTSMLAQYGGGAPYMTSTAFCIAQLD